MAGVHKQESSKQKECPECAGTGVPLLRSRDGRLLGGHDLKKPCKRCSSTGWIAAS